MNLSIDQQKSLIAMLDKWVRNTRIRRYLPPDANFVYMTEDRVTFNLTLLDEEYILKFIFCKHRHYINDFVNHVREPLEYWLICNHLCHHKFTIKFEVNGSNDVKDVEIYLPKRNPVPD